MVYPNKVSEEFDEPTQDGLFSKINNTQELFLPISFGDRHNHDKLWVNNHDAFVDTGCNTTTFHISLLNKIMEVRKNYIPKQTSINVINGSSNVLSGLIDIIFCDKEYFDITVNFADIPYYILIGRDLLGNGTLYCDAEKWISFNKH